MPLDPKDKKALAEALAHCDEARLDELHGKLSKLRDDLDDLNSAFPETQKFLRARGVSKVSELDPAGRQELTEHLQRVLAGLSD